MKKSKLFILIVSLLLPLILLYSSPAQRMSLLPTFEEPNTQKCDFQKVARVIDGDTFELSDSTKVRLIGVDTPETIDPRKEVQWFGREASKKLRKWIEGETVCLRQDINKTQDIDKYGRLLRYVWKYNTEKGTSDKVNNVEVFFVNAELIKQGYGFVYTRYPFQYLEDFRRYEREARENNRGLWNKKRYKVWEKRVKKNKMIAKTCGQEETICPRDAINYIGKQKTVRFFIKKSYDSGKIIFLNSKNNFTEPDNFTAIIFKEDKRKFPPSPADFYWGKTVDVTGIIKEYKGRAEIQLKNSSQIKIVE